MIAEMTPRAAVSAHTSDSMLLHDAGIVERAQALLRTSPFLALRQLRCACTQGVLIVSGRVPTFHARQVAVSILGTLSGADQLRDRIEVMFSAPREGTESRRMGTL